MRREKTSEKHRVLRFADDKALWTSDHVATEEPLEIRVSWEEDDGVLLTERIAVTMRTPGDDFSLAAGFLLSEGLLPDPSALLEISFCLQGTNEEQAYNIVSLRLRPGLRVDLERLRRKVFTTSSCGICGKPSLEAVEALGCPILPPPSVMIEARALVSLAQQAEDKQEGFAKTGGLHGAAIFGGDGKVERLREDIGRHNAVDKVIGSYLLEKRWPLHDRGLWVSGRASFEILQKAWMAALPLVVAVGPPSNLAIEIAKRARITLIGFLRGGRFNLYCGAERIHFPSSYAALP